MTRTRTWIAGTAVLAVLILLAGWLLLINPQRSEAAELREAAAAARTTNATLQVRLDELVAKSAGLPALQARVAAVRSRLPSQTELPELIRSLTNGASGAGLNLTGIVPSTPTLVTAAAAGDPATGGAAAAPSATGDQLYAINVALTLTGSYAGVSSFVNQLEELTRAFQVTGFTIAQNTGEGSARGSVQLSLQGRVFVLSSIAPEVPAPAAVEPAPSQAPTPAPAPAFTPPAVSY
jgi:type IV pilus assembly protein PilO